jgi:hypothetical protein
MEGPEQAKSCVSDGYFLQLWKVIDYDFHVANDLRTATINSNNEVIYNEQCI